MDKFIARLLKDYEDKKLSRRQLVQTIKIAAATWAGGEAAANAAPSSGFKTIAVNHISYECPDYTIARDFYQHLMGMGVVLDDGQQCVMPFGYSANLNAGTHLIPRGNLQPPAQYTASGTVSPTAQRATATPGPRSSVNSARGGQVGQQRRPPSQARIDHIALTCKNWDRARVKSILESWGLFPIEDGDSFHVRDPFGFNLQISGPGMTGFPETNQRTPGVK